MPTTGTGFKKLEEKVAAGKPLTFTEQNIVNRASGTPVVKPTQAPVLPPPVTPSPVTPLFKTVNPIQDKLDAAAQERERQQNQAVLSNPSAYSLDAVNKANAWQAGQQPGKTISQQAESQMMGEFKTNYDEALKRGITLPYKTFEEYKAWKQRPIDQATSYTQQQQDLARMSEGLKFEKARTDIDAAKAGNVAALAQGREGVQSAGNVMARSQFAAEMERQKQQMNIERQSAEAQRVKAMADLKRAREEGDVSLATAIQGQISQIESNLRQIDTQALQAATQASAEARAVEAQKMNNLNTFKGFLTEGIEMPASAISSFADMSGLDSGMLAQAYLGAQSIRADKNLSREEKQAKLADLQIDLDRKQKGLDDEALRATATLQAMYKRGASAQEIADYKSAAKITDQNDPVYQAELQVKQAEARIKQAEANGQIVNPLDKVKYAAALADLKEKNGDTSIYAPLSSKYEITTTPDGIKVNVPLDKNGRPANGRVQCGAFVNDVLGIGVGDTLASKTRFIDKSIILPSAGMAFVTSRGYDLGAGKGNSGHIGIVESVNPDGTFNTVESNYNGDGKLTRRENVPVTEVLGFVRPPNAEVIGGNQNIGIQELTADQINIFRSWDGKTVPKAWGGSAESFKRAYNDFQKKLTDPNISLSDKMRFSTGGKELLDKQSQKMDSFAMVVTGLQSLEKNLASVDTNELAPLVGIIQNNNPWDDKRKEIDSILTSIVPGLARGVYGEVGVLTDADVARYKNLLPTLRDTKSQREALLGLLKESLSKGVENTIRSAASSGRDVSQYTDLVDYVTSKTNSQKVDLNDTSSLMRVYNESANAPTPQFTQSFDAAWSAPASY